MSSLITQHDRAIVGQQGSFAELVVKAAAACNKIVIDQCGLCTVYCDKQVQYESVLEQYTANPLGDLFSKLDNSTEVQVYRDNMFDEESVVEQATSRQEDE